MDMHKIEVAPVNPWHEFKIEDAALWDTEILTANDKAEFFENTRAFSRRIFSEALTPKFPDKDVNLVGVGGYLPRGHNMRIRSILLRVDGYSTNGWPTERGKSGGLVESLVMSAPLDLSACEFTFKLGGDRPRPIPINVAHDEGPEPVGYVFSTGPVDLVELELFKPELRAPQTFVGAARIKCYLLGSLSINLCYEEDADRRVTEKRLLEIYGNPFSKKRLA